MSNIADLKHVSTAALFQGAPTLDKYQRAEQSANLAAELIRVMPTIGKQDAAIIIRALSSRLNEASSLYNGKVVAMLDDAADRCDKGDSMMVAQFVEDDERKAAKRRGLA